LAAGQAGTCLEPVRRSRGAGLGVAGLTALAVVAFLVGLAIGGRGDPAPSASPAPAFAGARVGQELRLAYLDVIDGRGF
jgi:hypothetical protein